MNIDEIECRERNGYEICRVCMRIDEWVSVVGNGFGKMSKRNDEKSGLVSKKNVIYMGVCRKNKEWDACIFEVAMQGL